MELKESLLKIVGPHQIKMDLIDRLAFSSDAGFYKLIPKAVVQPTNKEEINKLFQFAKHYGLPIVFRTGGTSLSGQSITDGILVDLSKYWRKAVVEDSGEFVRVQPGITGAMVNHQLKKYGKKIGPDPSSISAAMMGGIIANNASGMCCGVKHNAYHTLKYISILLPDGKGYSTENADDYIRFEIEQSAISKVLKESRDQIFLKAALKEKIRAKYLTKNTVGYALNAFLDYEKPLDILAHLMVGSEGTLGFIAEAVLQTVSDLPFKATALFYFPTIEEACRAITPLTNVGAEALELMDRASLRSIENVKGVPEIIKSLPENAAALLCEFQTNSKVELDKKLSSALPLINNLSLLHKPEFTTDSTEQDFIWKIRKGLFPSVGAIRQQGTTVVLEDIAFPINKLADGVLKVQELFVKHGYDNGIIFGHAKDGNIHFVITQSFNSAQEIERYKRFMDELVHEVVNTFDGTLKAEHGTGRNMSPFVETEWGGDAYAIMKKIKQTIDPNNILNPGVIINEDKQAHLKNLKSLPEVESEVDKCIECGFCEPNCPSRNLTLTPRQRIVVRREIQLLKNKRDFKNAKEVIHDYQYKGIETCAVDGLCATDCPVEINTGTLVKRLRRENHSTFSNRFATILAKNFSKVEFIVRVGIRLGTFLNILFGKSFMWNFTKTIKYIIPAMPLWNNNIYPSKKLNYQITNNPSFVYWPTCITRCMGNENGKDTLSEKIIQVAEKAGISLRVPKVPEGFCCGQPFSSKGYLDASKVLVNDAIEKLWETSEKGNLPIIIDGSSCTYTILQSKDLLNQENKVKFEKLQFIDAVEFAEKYVVSRLKINNKKKDVVLHPVCSLKKMNLTGSLIKVASSCSVKVTVPLEAGCCGMAGDRGFLFPELTKSAIQFEKDEIVSGNYNGFYSCGKTCELALSENTGQNYESIFYLLDEVSD